MGYPHITDLNLSHHPFSNAKPTSSPLMMPKPITTTASSALSPCHACPNPTTNLLALSHADLATNISNVGSKAELSNEQPLGSSRWSPTPEQLLALEELYRRGTRTPSAAQIQQIALRLRRFGKIEGKNVFYWFQNHKARERLKRRREVLETEHEQPQHHQLCNAKSLETKEPAGSGSEIEGTKNKVLPPTNLSKIAEEFISTHGVAAESGQNEWTQIQDKELQQIKCTVRRSVSTWQACSPIYLINSLNSATSLAAKTALNTQNSCLLENITTLEDENREEQTLELFPLRSNYKDHGINIGKEDTTQVPIRAINTSFTPNQYFEFFPLKN